MQRLSSFAFLTALVSLSLAGACKSDDAGGSNAPQQPTTTAAGAPGAEEPAAAGEDGRRVRRGWKNMTPEERRETRRAERLQRFDKNGDGRLDRDERATMKTELVTMRMQRIDSDGDGKITRQEASSGRIGPRLLADFDRADTNRDSVISREELEAAIEVRRAERRAEKKDGGGAPAAPRETAPSPAEEDDGDALDEE